MHSITEKIKSVITSKLFCGICFEICDDVFALDSEQILIGDFETRSLLVKDILNCVLHSNVSESLSAPIICGSCFSKATELYLFIKNFQSCQKLVSSFIDELCLRTMEISVKKKLKSTDKVVVILDSEDGVKSSFKCSICRESPLFHSFDDLVKHEAKHGREQNLLNRKNKHQNGLSKLGLNKKPNNKVALTSLEKKGFCKICNKELGNYQKLKKHTRQVHGSKFDCTIFDKTFSVNYYKQHMLTHKLGKTVHRCTVCADVFSSKQILQSHIKNHTEVFPCPKCGRMFENRHLLKHLKNHTMNQRQRKRMHNSGFLCEYCDYKTQSSANLESHINHKHKKIKPYICEVCGKEFCGKVDLNKHSEAHTVAKKIECRICGTIVANKKCWVKHLRRHTGEKPYSCNECGDAFITLDILKVHKIKKHSTRNIACPLCDSMFFLLTDMRCHFKSVHWKHKDKPFDHTQVKELPKEFYHLFEDQRRRKDNGNDFRATSK